VIEGFLFLITGLVVQGLPTRRETRETIRHAA